MENDIENIKNERKELKDELKISKEDLEVAYEIEPLEVQHLKVLLNKTKNLYDNLIRQYNLLSIKLPTETTRDTLREIYARKRDDLFIELDYIVSRKDYFTPNEAINILGINESEFNYELKNNPARLLSLIFNNIDDKSKYILGRIMDKQQPDKMDIETLKQEYATSTGEFYDKVFNVYFDKLIELNNNYKIESIDKLIKIKPAVDEIISGLLSLTTILSAGMDLIISIIRGFDETISELNKNKDSLQNEIKGLEKNIKTLESSKEKLNSEVEEIRGIYNKESDKLKKLELKIREMETRLEIENRQQPQQQVFEPQLLDGDNDGNAV